MIILNCVSLIILIIFEIVLTAFCVKKLINADTNVQKLSQNLSVAGSTILAIFYKTKDIVFKTNKFVSILTSKKLLRIHSILKYTLNIAEIYFLIRTLDFSKGSKKLTFKNIKKLLFTEAAKKLIFKAINFVCH